MKNVLVKFGLAFVAIAVLFGVFSWKDWIIAFSKPVDINVDYPEDYNDVKAVETELCMLVDIFAEEEITKKSDTGAVTSRNYIYYYIAPVFTEEDVFYVGVKVDKEDSSPYDRVVNSTWAYLNGDIDYLDEEVAFTGGFTKMDDELYGYFEDWFEEAEIFETEDEMNAHILPLLLEPMVFKNVKTTAYVMIGLLVVGAVMLFFGFRSGRQNTKASRPVITINGVNYPSANLVNVNKMIKKGETANAIKELQRITGAEPEDAASVVSRWNEYWG